MGNIDTHRAATSKSCSVQELAKCWLTHVLRIWNVSCWWCRKREIHVAGYTKVLFKWVIAISIPGSIYLFKVNNENISTICEICSNLTIQTPEWRHWIHSGVNIVKLEHSESSVSIVAFEQINGGWDSDIRRTFQKSIFKYFIFDLTRIYWSIPEKKTGLKVTIPQNAFNSSKQKYDLWYLACCHYC